MTDAPSQPVATGFALRVRPARIDPQVGQIYSDDRAQRWVRFTSTLTSALESAIHNADLIAVFWSLNASTSEEVAREYRLALAQGKPIVPVLLDDSQLPDELAQFQGVVLTDLFGIHDPSFDPLPYVRQMVVRFLANG